MFSKEIFMKTKYFYQWMRSDGTFHSLITHFLDELWNEKGFSRKSNTQHTEIDFLNIDQDLETFKRVFGKEVNVKESHIGDIGHLYDTCHFLQKIFKDYLDVLEDYDSDTPIVYDEFFEKMTRNLYDLTNICVQNRLRLISSDLLQPLMEGGVQ